MSETKECCPVCGVVLKEGLYGDVFYCESCGLDFRAEEVLFSDEQLTDDPQEYTIIIRGITNKEWEDIEKEIDKIDGSVTYWETSTSGMIFDLCSSEKGKQFLKSEHIEEQLKYDFRIELDFIDGIRSKETVIAELFKIFPVSILREEKSNYIICTNRGLANMFSDLCLKDDKNYDIFALSCLLTGFEKYLILKDYFNVGNFVESDVMLAWKDGGLIAYDALVEQNKEYVKFTTISYLAQVESIKFSISASDPGKDVSFIEILEPYWEFCNYGGDDEIVICSVRGAVNYIGEVDDTKK